MEFHDIAQRALELRRRGATLDADLSLWISGLKSGSSSPAPQPRPVPPTEECSYSPTLAPQNIRTATQTHDLALARRLAGMEAHMHFLRRAILS
jgi:hypothetical protein